MRHLISSGRQFSVKLDSRISIFRYIQNYHDLNISGFNRLILYDI